MNFGQHINELISYIRLESENHDIINIFVYTNNICNKQNCLNNLDIKKYRRCNKQNIECSICCENVKNTEYIRELNCNHTFHKKCIDKWLLCSMKEYEDVRCPICRTNINII
jgi:E3 ubiquitin-protein ligase RHA2